ncbi:MAG TPA: alpha/beta hydrolase [Chloroflexota bacterium]|nr:alpha/beta hydrolase [Chloroflexota bacterium]
MTTQTSLAKHATAGTQPFTTGLVTSKDGTTIGYRQFGHGPGVVLLHGTMSSAHNHVQLAEGMADAFTIFVPDRRGRGLSGPFGDDYSIQTEVDDLDALLAKTGAQHVFGVSSGGIICLQAALTLPAIRKAAIFEPPFFADRPLPAAALARFDRELARGKVAASLITAMKAAQVGPPIFNAIPRPLLELLTGMALKGEEKKGSGGYVSMRALAPTLHYDFQLVAEMNARLESFRAIRAEVLLLGGSKSPAYLKGALDALEKVLPRATRVELAGLDHAASWNSDRGGKPGPVAQELRRFFA